MKILVLLICVKCWSSYFLQTRWNVCRHWSWLPGRWWWWSWWCRYQWWLRWWWWSREWGCWCWAWGWNWWKILWYWNLSENMCIYQSQFQWGVRVVGFLQMITWKKGWLVWIRPGTNALGTGVGLFSVRTEPFSIRFTLMRMIDHDVGDGDQSEKRTQNPIMEYYYDWF